MTTTITTNELQSKFTDIIETYYQFIKGFDFGKNGSIYKLILGKILTNLCSANILWSRGMCYDAYIILRSAFNSYILFEYLISFPNEVETFKVDSEIAEFKNLFGYYKRGYLTLEQLTEVFINLKDKSKSKLKINVNPKTNILNFKLDKLEKTLENQRSITQKMHKMMKELQRINKPHFEEIKEYSLIIWNINSQITHGEFYQLKDNFIYKDKKEIEKQTELLIEIQNCFRQSVCILAHSMNTISSTVKNENGFRMSIWNKIIPFYEYIGQQNIAELIKQSSVKQSDLIQIIKNPIFVSSSKPT